MEWILYRKRDNRVRRIAAAVETLSPFAAIRHGEVRKRPVVDAAIPLLAPEFASQSAGQEESVECLGMRPPDLGVGVREERCVAFDVDPEEEAAVLGVPAFLEVPAHDVCGIPD